MKDGLTLLCNIRKPARAFLADLYYVKEALIGIAKGLGLTPVEYTFSCHFFPSEDSECQDWGLSAQVVLLESHIYVHTWPELGYARLELSSCRKFDVEKALDSIILFSRGEVDHVVVEWNKR